MIQRRQSLWLFLAALLNAGVFYFDVYRYHVPVQRPLSNLTVAVDSVVALRVVDNFPSLLLALIITALPLVAIFMFRNRKLQVRLSILGLFAIVAFTALQLWRVTNLAKQVPPPASGSYWIGAILPVIAFVLMILAIVGVRKDEKLVRSMDRLRD